MQGFTPRQVARRARLPGVAARRSSRRSQGCCSATCSRARCSTRCRPTSRSRSRSARSGSSRRRPSRSRSQPASSRRCWRPSRPLLDLLSRGPIDAVHDERGELGEGLGPTLRRRMLLAAGGLLIATTAAVALVPRLTLVRPARARRRGAAGDAGRVRGDDAADRPARAPSPPQHAARRGHGRALGDDPLGGGGGDRRDRRVTATSRSEARATTWCAASRPATPIT